MSKRSIFSKGASGGKGVVHKGGKIGKIAKKLANPKTPKKERKKAASSLSKHGHDPILHPEN